LIDRFMPVWDVCERIDVVVHAPAHVVDRVARQFEMESIPLVRAIFWLRGKLMGAKPVADPGPQALVARMRAIGWGTLADAPSLLIAGAVTQPWHANPTFTAVPAAAFAEYAAPDQVKIVWTLEAHPAGADLTVFTSETRAVATNASARRRFLRYWSVARFGIVLIRRLIGPAVRRRAEREWQASQRAEA
jgi:hypothetical protein